MIGYLNTAEFVVELVVPGQPQPKERARTGKGGGYTPERTKAAEERIGWQFNVAARKHEVDSESQFHLDISFHCSGKRRRDVDNLLKLTMDALNMICWKDDSQVASVTARKFECPKGEERTVIRIDKWRIEDG